YQRLLARDEDEAEDIVEAYRAEHTLAETCDELLLGTLLALKRDLAANRIMQNDGDFVASALEEIVDTLAAERDDDEDAAADGSSRPPGPCPRLIGLPVRDRLDELALELLALLLRKEIGRAAGRGRA